MTKKAVVVDDDSSNLLLEKDLLEVVGFTVFEAVNAFDGIALAVKEKPDIIIMDVRLPGMRGSEAARILRLDKQTCNIPIVFVSAGVLPESIKETDGIVNTSFIGKPINTRTFAKEIAEFIKLAP